MTCARTQELVPILEDLADDDPERADAMRHLRSCARCAAQAVDAERILAEMDRLPAPDRPEPADLRRAFVAVESRIRERSLGVARWAIAAGLLAVTILGALALRRLPAEVFLVAPFLAAAVLASLVAAAGFSRGAWAAAVALAASAALALLVGRPGAQAHLRVGLGECALLELVTGLVVAGVGLGAAWIARVSPGRSMAAALGAAGALAAQGALLLRCPGREHAHLFLFHVGAVFVAAGLAAATARLLGQRR